MDSSPIETVFNVETYSRKKTVLENFKIWFTDVSAPSKFRASDSCRTSFFTYSNRQ